MTGLFCFCSLFLQVSSRATDYRFVSRLRPDVEWVSFVDRKSLEMSVPGAADFPKAKPMVLEKRDIYIMSVSCVHYIYNIYMYLYIYIYITCICVYHES